MIKNTNWQVADQLAIYDFSMTKELNSRLLRTNPACGRMKGLNPKLLPYGSYAGAAVKGMVLKQFSLG